MTIEMPYTAPTYNATAFNCPFCDAYANFLWRAFQHKHAKGMTTSGLMGGQCQHCKQWTVWVSRIVTAGGSVEGWRMVHPRKVTAPKPSEDMPGECVRDYEEARFVLADSPRSSAALLRLCIQRLSTHLGGKGKDLNKDIGTLVKAGLDERIQKALDIVRVTGNNAVHPGEMSLDDNPEVAAQLFKLTNMIVDEMITKPKELKDLYGALPDGAKDAIEQRDNSMKGKGKSI